jgi:hypothetical protein
MDFLLVSMIIASGIYLFKDICKVDYKEIDKNIGG